MLLLALDTATPAVTVAVCDDSGVLADSTVVDARRHGELLAPGIAAVLAAAGIDRRDLTDLAVGVGPGPFTGLRVGVMTARTLGAVLAIPVHGMCSLDVLAFESGLEGTYRVASDARRREVYWAAYEGRRRIEGPHVARPGDAAWAGPTVGAGAQLYPEAFPDGRGPALPSATGLCRYLLSGLATTEPHPMYLRRPDAVEATARKSVLP